VNNHNVAWTNGSNFTSIFNADGTTWGFAGGTGDDVVNLMWGNGSMGASFGLGMTPETKIADGDLADADAVTALDIGFGMPLAGMDFGFTYGMGCDMCGGGNVGVNLRRAQNVWLWDTMLINFGMLMEEKTDDVVTTPSNMAFGTSFYSNTSYDSGTNGLFAFGFGYNAAGDPDGDGAAEAPDAEMGINWNFAVESAMTDWATLRVGYVHGYDFATGGTDVAGVEDDDMTDDDETVEQVNGLSLGLGFNYGSFNLDMSISEGIFNDPVKYMTGRNLMTPLGANWTISYAW
jgi:hypothetical protein